MMIGMALFWGAIILGIVWLIRNGTEPQQRQPKETPLTILDRRLAEGSVSLEEYRERRNELTGTTMPRAARTQAVERREPPDAAAAMRRRVADTGDHHTARAT
jgi:hypothetical protein